MRKRTIAFSESIRALVHVDVEDLRAVLHLLAGDLHRLLVALLLDHLAELRAAGDVGAFADIDEQQLRGDDQRFQAGQAGVAGRGCSSGHHQTL
ncbi:hypothetical protein QE386_000735 [Pseudoxanthomonas winnipegensis]|nr:hypothetical protein [Pseudoxanthomonas winnipegensis]